MDTTDINAAVDNALKHYGVLGMKWGVRKARGAGPGPASAIIKKRKAGRAIATSGGQRHPHSEDAKRSAVSKQVAKKSSTDALSNDDLKALVSRMNMEQQYANLTAKQKSGAKKFISGLMGNQTKQLAEQVSDAKRQEIAKALIKKTAKTAAASAVL